ncbi:MAG: hypothetical protein KJ884_04670 [Gammaproteobacteria bacterium]|nr:hypothetical protein [Gammaproteobacteria bacterium]MBU1491200.1 hypothetical protein [Gammaproteobacteria bacterium]MBU2067866.1 hypothetical protein [Gammaproteobacteria bacterium]MBU2139354.1 hypothetical protein [Gammaproteobacteria bacterium]MBU2217226.1 hypothetical protein [Gammaproteobacteria bacterium]
MTSSSPCRENLNDPDAKPADLADHQRRREDAQVDAELTGGRNDNQGHTPRLDSWLVRRK